MNYRARCLMILGLLLVALGVVMPALAAPTFMNLSPVWRPGTQLDTDLVADSNNARFVDVEFFVQSNIQFWAADITCTVNKAALSSYVVTPGGDPGDDVAVVRWGPDWGVLFTDFTEVPLQPPSPTTKQGFNTSTGAMTFTATRQGAAKPLGKNGLTYTLLVATVRFKVLALAANATSTLTCSMMQFLDRNGTKVATPVLTKTPMLNIFVGYSLAGKITYQGAASSLGIGVTCQHLATATTYGPITTDAMGNFKFTNLRQLGRYNCDYFGNVKNPAVGRQDDSFLAGGTKLLLQNPSYTLYPTMLNGGNVSLVPAPQTISSGDLTLVTSNWRTSVATPYLSGDTNGDKLINQIDLAIVTGNYGLDEDTTNYANMYSHVLYSLARDYDSVFPNSHIWRGTPLSGAVVSQVSLTTRDFSPTTSPDGTKIAFSRYNAATSRYDLYVVPAAGGVATKLTPATFTLNAFAPSWSPDGARVAFICSGNTINSGYQYDQGALCVVDADGRNFNQVADKTRIYPPTWFNNSVVVYAGHGVGALGSSITANPTCGNSLCYYDFSFNTVGLVSANVQFPGPQIVDMPVIRSKAPDTYLFYRHNDGIGNRRIRAAANITYTPGAGFTIASFPAPLHDNLLQFPAPYLSTDVDYYTVQRDSDTLAIMFYETGGSGFYNSYGPTAFPTWSNVTPVHSVDGQVDNPTWTGNPDNPSDLFALRTTVEWLP